MATNMTFVDGATVIPADWLNFVNTVVNTGGGTGTVTSVSVVSANGFAGSVATANTTPAITITTTINGLLKGNATAISAASAGTDYVAPGGALGTPSSGTLTNCVGLPVTTGLSGLGTGVAAALAINTGSAGAFVLYNGALGTPSSGTLTNATGLPVATGISGFGTGIATALAINTGSAGAPVLYNGAGGTPSSVTLTNGTGLPISTGVSGLGANVATLLATPSSANLRSALTDETGTGVAVFNDTPTINSPALNNTNLTGLKLPVYNSQPTSTGTTGAVTVDWSAGAVYKQNEPTGGITYTFTAPGVSNVHLQLLIDSDGTSASQTMTWPGTVVWYGAALSATTANKRHIVNFWYDGTNYHGAYMTQV
jgi:hypothetical protein